MDLAAVVLAVLLAVACVAFVARPFLREPAPDFELQSDSGETVRLSELRGKPVVLYFYPKDDTNHN